MSDSLSIKYNSEITIPGGYSAKNPNTNDGSPSLVTMKNESSQNKITASITLGQKSEVYNIYPKETATFPKDGAPVNFNGLALAISNNTQPGTPADLNVMLTAN